MGADEPDAEEGVVTVVVVFVLRTADEPDADPELVEEGEKVVEEDAEEYAE